MFSFITRQSLSFLIVLSSCLMGFFFITSPALAGDPITVQRGAVMPAINWSVQGAPDCRGSFATIPTTYPNIPSPNHVFNTWNNSIRSSVGTESFAGMKAIGNVAGTWPQTYIFKCRNDVANAEDTATLTITDCPGGEEWKPATLSCGPAVTAPANPPANMNGSCPAPGTSATVSWPAVADATYYALRVDNQTTGGWNGTCNASAGDFCQDINGLTHTYASVASNQYNNWVHACNVAGCSATAASANFICTPATPAPAVGSVTATPSPTCGSKQITISWPNVPSAESYQVYRNGVQVADLGQPTLSFVDTVPSDGTPYTYSVGTWSAVGGMSSTQTTANPNPVTSPATCVAPTLALSVAPNPITLGDSTTLTWTITGTADGCWASNSWGGWKSITSSSEIVTPATTGTYTYSLECWNAGLSNGVENAVLVVNVPTPSSPSGVTAVTGTCGGVIDVAWGASTFADTYEISLNGGASWPYTGIAGTSYTITGLPVNITYNNIVVRALNAISGPSPASSPAVTATASNYCGDLNITSCPLTYIQDGQATCPGNIVNWNITGAVPATSNITRLLPLPVTALNTGNVTGGPLPVTLYYGANQIAARDNNIIVQDRTLNVACRPESFFHNDIGTCLAKPEIEQVTPDPIVIRSGNTASIRYRIRANYDLRCSFSGAILAAPIDHNANGDWVTYPAVTTNILTAGQIVRMSCNTRPNAYMATPAQIDTRINVLPAVQEN